MSLITTHNTDIRIPVSIAQDIDTRGNCAFDWAAAILSGAFIGGVFLDGWAHTHGRVDDTFFTPWHAILYAAFLALATLLVGRAVWGLAGLGSGRAAVPDGYGWALAGVVLWVVGAPFDLVWHAVFGFEADVEALMSPAHAILALGYGLMASGPLRAALRRRPGRWRDELPLVLSLTFVVSSLTFFTQIAHPIANLWAARGAYTTHDATELGIVSLLLTTVILISPLLLLLRHARLPAGAVFIFIALNTVAMGFVYDRGPYPVAVVVALVAAGAVAEVLRALLRPSPGRPVAFRTFAFLLPALLHVAYFAALHLTTGIGWTVHLWLGVIVFSGAIGWLVSYLVLPPRLSP